MLKPTRGSRWNRLGSSKASCRNWGMVLVSLLWGSTGCGPGWFDSARTRAEFNLEVRPILRQNCLKCHGGVHRRSGLSLLFRSDALRPAESGKPAIIPGDPQASEMIRRVEHADPEERMPLKQPPLTPEEIRVLKRWVAQGAEWEDHWAYVKPSAVRVPNVVDRKWPANQIDSFVLARLEREGLRPSQPADCATLLRRLSLDLVGLPPTWEEVEEFCSDAAEKAYERQVDRLLASPRFGERWAAMWLDLARYADTKGYEKDGPRTIWRYRDWVIKAFNQDMPFDQFTIEQLAGDLLPEPRESQLIATAFHRNTMTNDEGGTDDEEFRTAAVIDRVNSTWEVWMGTTFACGQCHDHPYDPFRQEEYYRFLAFFNNTADRDLPDESPTLVSFLPEYEEGGQELHRQIEAIRERIERESGSPTLAAEREAWEGRLRQAIEREGVPPLFEEQMIPSDVLSIVGKPAKERGPDERARVRRHYASISPVLEPLRKKIRVLEKSFSSLEPIRTPIMRELPAAERRTTHVFERGNFLVRGKQVVPGVPSSMPAFPEDLPANRLGLARWLVRPENPLTARVLVNRIWEQVFGAGIVRTLEDFGTQGQAPSHPQLLDWLAVEFMEKHGWSIKKLLKAIVMSATYRQSSRATPELLERDPHNRLLARGARFRLSAEQIRDQALEVAGLRSERMFGPGVMPPQPEGIWRSPYSGMKWQASEAENRYRRGIYTYWKRTTPYPSMVTFDSPSREFCVSRRIRTNTPLQALVSLNDPVFVEAARSLAARMSRAEESRQGDSLRLGFQLALLRRPGEEELASLRDFFRGSRDYYEAHPEEARRLAGEDVSAPSAMAALTATANVILNLDEFVTRN